MSIQHSNIPTETGGLSSLVKLPAHSQRQLLVQGQLSSVELVTAHINRLECVNPKINALVASCFEQALDQAERIDSARLIGEQLPHWAGVPCTIKECFAVEGMPNSAGLMSRKDLRSSHTALAVQRLVDAGFIPLGLSNLSELCMWMESINHVYGRTNNPYDLSRTVGGSSGGEGALVSSACSPLGLGSDIGGSIRIPAFFNGIFGHKASSNAIPNDGQYPNARPAAQKFLCTGPLARTSKDLWGAFLVLSGQPNCPLPSLDLSSRKVVSITDDGFLSVSPELKFAQQQAVDVLSSMGAQTEELALPELKHAAEIWSAMLETANGGQFGEQLFEGTGSVFRAVLTSLMGRGPHTLPALALAFLERLAPLQRKRMKQMIELGSGLAVRLEAILQQGNLLLYPSHPVCAPKHHHSKFLPIRWSYTAIWNVLGLPVTQVPLGLSTRGLPLGVQIVAPFGGDVLSIACAEILETELGGWVAPSL